MRIMPYKLGSKSAKALAQHLGIKRCRVNSKEFRNNYNHVIVNWGSGILPNWWQPRFRIINHPDKVAVAGNKLLTFQALEDTDVRIPEFTTRLGEADDWLQQEKLTVVVRKYLRAHSGKGIVIIDGSDPDHDDLPIAPLYVKYVKKAAEFRIHVFGGKVIDIQQKRKRQELDKEDVNFQVRNLDGGWVFCRGDLDVPHDVKVQAVRAVQGLGLDFGAVDIGWNQYHKEATVFEVNTACGLEGTTVELYAKALKEYLAHEELRR